MNILSIIQIIFGLLISLFLPGYLLARIFFNELESLEKIALGFVLSIALDIIIGLFLGYNKTMKDITGGITAMNLWIYLGTITILLFAILMLKDKNDRNSVTHVFKRLFERKK